MFNMLKPLHHSLAKKIQSIAIIVSMSFCVATTPALAVVKSYKKAADGVTFSLDKGLLKVLVRRADMHMYEQKNAYYAAMRNRSADNSDTTKASPQPEASSLKRLL